MVPELRRTVPPAAELADYDRAARARTVPSQHTAVAWWVSCQASDQVSVYRERKTGDPAVMARIRNYFDGRNGMPPGGRPVGVLDLLVPTHHTSRSDSDIQR